MQARAAGVPDAVLRSTVTPSLPIATKHVRQVKATWPSSGKA